MKRQIIVINFIPRGDFDFDSKQALFSLLGKDFVYKHITREPFDLEEMEVDKIVLENMKKYLEEVSNIALVKTDKKMIDNFVNNKSKELLALSQDQSKQAVIDAMNAIICHENAAEDCGNLMEAFHQFSSSCVPFPRKMRSLIWDNLMMKLEKPRRRDVAQFSSTSSVLCCDKNLKKEVINFHMKVAGLEESVFEVTNGLV